MEHSRCDPRLERGRANSAVELATWDLSPRRNSSQHFRINDQGRAKFRISYFYPWQRSTECTRVTSTSAPS